MRIKIEYEYDPKSSAEFPYWAKTDDKYFSAKSFEGAKQKVIAYYKSLEPVIVPPPEEIEFEGD